MLLRINKKILDINGLVHIKCLSEWKESSLCIAHTFSRVSQIYSIKNKTKFYIISRFFLADEINILLQYYDILLHEYGLNHLHSSLPSPHTNIQFHDKIAQEQKSSTSQSYSYSLREGQ